MLKTYLISDSAFKIEWGETISEETTAAIAIAERFLDSLPSQG